MRTITFAALLIGASALKLAQPGLNLVKLESDTQQHATSSATSILKGEGCKTRSPEEWKTFNAPQFPEVLKNRNILVFGDSVDRCGSLHLCQMFGAEPQAPMINGQPAEFIGAATSSNPHHVCHFNQFNSTLLYKAHAGAMSTSDEHNWHEQQRVDEKACYHHFGDYRDWMGWQMLQKAPLKCQIESASDLSKTYALKNMVDGIPARPTLLVVQSSLWDAVYSGKVLQKHGKPLQFNQQDLPVSGWKWNTDGVAAWDWEKHATELVDQSRNRGVQFEKSFWRTNSNCPAGKYGEMKEQEQWTNTVMEEQAKVARAKVASQEGPWSGMYLMDWRDALDARSKELCDGIHYQPEGYDSYVETLFGSIDKAFH